MNTQSVAKNLKLVTGGNSKYFKYFDNTCKQVLFTNGDVNITLLAVDSVILYKLRYDEWHKAEHIPLDGCSEISMLMLY